MSCPRPRVVPRHPTARARRRIATALLGLLVAALVATPDRRASAEDFPRPAGLEPDIAFWVRVYSEVDTQAGLLHDARDLGVVYEVLRFRKGTSARSRERHVERARKRIKATLEKLARGRRSGLSREERRILALFPDDVRNDTLRAASRRIRFQLGQVDKFRAGLVRSGAWRDHIRHTFQEMGLPTELASLPHVESSFTPHARSHVGASGLWQFTRSTGRRYMRVDHVVDERLDPFEATRAAGRLLEANKLITGTWPLALTSYNHGASGMRRASRKLGTTDIEKIVRRYKSRTFGFASRNFYVEFLAARQVETNSHRYFGPIVLAAPVDYEEIELPFYARASTLAASFGVPLETLKKANPALSRLVWSGEKFVPRGHAVRVPRAQLPRPLAVAIDDVPTDERYAAQTPDSTHRVRRGDTLSGIAARYGTTASELARLNKLRSRHRIRVGQVLRLPWRGGRGPAPRAGNGVYTVQRGDNVSKIARRFGLSEGQLLSLNNLPNRNRIRPGQKLRVAPQVASAARPSPETSGSYTVRRGDTISKIAKRQGMKTRSLLAMNGLSARDRIYPGQTLRTAAGPTARTKARGDDAAATAAKKPKARAAAAAIDETPSLEAPERSEVVTAAEPAVLPDAPAGDDSPQQLRKDLLADPADYSVADDDSIEVQPAETLGHVAEWLDVRASRLRSLNGLRYGTPLEVHQRLVLDFTEVSRAEFERRRLEHHRALQTEFFERYEIAGTRSHRLRRGESAWVIARQSRVPIWLLQQYNPDVDFSALQAGARITIPQLRPHRPGGSAV